MSACVSPPPHPGSNAVLPALRFSYNRLIIPSSVWFSSSADGGLSGAGCGANRNQQSKVYSRRFRSSIDSRIQKHMRKEGYLVCTLREVPADSTPIPSQESWHYGVRNLTPFIQYSCFQPHVFLLTFWNIRKEQLLQKSNFTNPFTTYALSGDFIQ